MVQDNQTNVENSQINQSVEQTIMIHNSGQTIDTQQPPRLLCKTQKYTLSAKLSTDNEQATLILAIPNQGQNIINIYEANIEAKSEVGQVLDNLFDLLDYLEESRNFKVNYEDGSIVLISRTEVKGKQKQIQLCNIEMSLKKVIKIKQQIETNWIKNLQQIQKSCRTHELLNTELAKYVSTIARYLLQSSNQQQNQQKSSQSSSSIEPIINKIVHLGKQQEMIKDKIADCNQQIKQVQLVIMNIENKCVVSQSEVIQVRKIVEEVRVTNMKRYDRFQNQLEVGLVEMKEFVSKMFEELSRQIQLIKRPKDSKNIAGLLKQQYALKTPYQFSSVLRHRSTKLITPKSIQGIDNVRSKICLITPCINMLGEGQQKSIHFKIVNEASDVLVGLCDFDKVRNLNYVIDSWGTGNHGGYYINSGGYLYSHYRKEDNDILKSFTFRDGDIIKITVCEAKRSITFENGSSECRVEYDNKIRPDKLYFCVVLHKSSSIVEIFE